MPSSGDRAPTAPAPRCTEHGGEHVRYLGHCVAMGAQVPRPLLLSRNAWDCDCGIRVYAVVERKTTRRFMVDEATGDQHRCQPSVRVRIDSAELADALAGAFEEVRRRRERPAAPLPQQEEPPQQQVERSFSNSSGALGSIPRLGQ